MKAQLLSCLLLFSITIGAGALDNDIQDSPKYKLSEIVVALKTYYLRKGKYPEKLEYLRKMKDFDTLGVALKDAWGNDYIYAPSKIDLSPASLYSAGENGIAEECLGDDICR